MESKHEEALEGDHDEERQPFISEEEKMLDVESQIPPPESQPDPAVSRSTTTAFLVMYFVMNVGLTFYNKLMLGSVG
jgi:hypothetical protein